MEPRKRMKYSKLLEPEEIQELIMEEESDEEVDINDSIEPHRIVSYSSSSSSSEEDDDDLDIQFRAEDQETRQKYYNSLDLRME
jgi:hypothetical protein